MTREEGHASRAGGHERGRAQVVRAHCPPQLCLCVRVSDRLTIDECLEERGARRGSSCNNASIYGMWVGPLPAVATEERRRREPARFSR